MWRVADLDPELPEDVTVWEDAVLVELRCALCGPVGRFVPTVTRQTLLLTAHLHAQRWVHEARRQGGPVPEVHVCPRCGGRFLAYTRNGVERGCPYCFVVLRHAERPSDD